VTLFGIFGIALGLLALRFAFVEPTRGRVAVFCLVFLVHIGSSLIFYVYAQTNVSDSRGYYVDDLNFAADGFGLATQFIYYIVQTSRRIVGGTFLDYFLVFQAFGLFGIALLMRTFEEIYRSTGVEQPPYVYLLLFLPGMHFWTSTIGKDAPLFLGVCLALWSALDIRKRYITLSLGILIVLVIRPHIGLIAAAAVAVTLLFDRATKFHTRLFLLLAAAGGLAVAVATVESTFRVDVTNADSVSDFFATQEQITRNSSETGNTAVTGSYAVKLFSLLFRPMFFDTRDAFGYIASFENLLLLFVIGTIIFRFRDTIALARSETFIRFSLVMAITIAGVLALVYYNVGLGLRQKTMFVPALLVVFVALMVVRKVRIVQASHEQSWMGELRTPISTYRAEA
jgi:hypothetical protein